MAPVSDLIERINTITSSGRVCWIVGENGAGKSMLLRSLADRNAGYYAPPIHFPANVTVADWRRFNLAIPADVEIISAVDGLCPEVPLKSRMDELSTGEAKRFLLWSLLRTPRRTFVLDEPFEHLSANAKARLHTIVTQLAHQSRVIVATNQDVPEDQPSVIELT